MLPEGRQEIEKGGGKNLLDGKLDDLLEMPFCSQEQKYASIIVLTKSF
jgi:hypothetical protein